MTYEDLLNRLITDGIAEVREAYADPKDHHKRDGAIEGFEACRGKAPAELIALWTEAEHTAMQIACSMREAARDRALAAVAQAASTSSSHETTYWRQRYKAMQIEFVCNVVSVGLVNEGQPPLLGHLPTMRGATKYASLVGVRGQGVDA